MLFVSIILFKGEKEFIVFERILKIIFKEFYSLIFKGNLKFKLINNSI
jgi:hypothetical protein